MNDIDIFKAFKDKERKNCERIWKQKEKYWMEGK